MAVKTGKPAAKKSQVKKKTSARKKVSIKAGGKTTTVTPMKKKESLIGVDPLAWIKEEDVVEQESNSHEERKVGENIRFSSSLNIQEVSELHKKMQAILENSIDAVLDLNEVELIDAAALQLMLTFNNEAKTKGITVQWSNVPEVVNQALELMGLESELTLS